MKQSKDPFEAAYVEQEESPPESPIAQDDYDTQASNAAAGAADDSQGAFVAQDGEDLGSGGGHFVHPSDHPSTSRPVLGSARTKAKNKDDDDEEEEDNMDVELSKLASTADPDKMAKMQAILAQFTEEQMSRYESFRRSALQKTNMKRLLVSITGTQKISLPMTIVVCGIAKMFVGELVETARIVMMERKESGPIRPCHIREAYRRLKLEGKILKRSVPRLFRWIGCWIRVQLFLMLFVGDGHDEKKETWTWDCSNVYRYQRVSPDCVPLSNGKKPNGGENGRSIPNGFNSSSTNFETKGFRFRSPSRNQDHHNNSTTSSPHSENNHNQTQRHNTSPSPSPSPSRGGSGDVLLQWGQKKRARVSRSEIRALADESSSSGQARQPINKIPRRIDNKSSQSTMPPPPPPPPFQQSLSTNTRGGNLKKENSGFLSHRNLEKRSGAGNGSPSRNSGGSSRAVSRSTAGKRSPPTPENIDRKMPSSRSAVKDEKPNGSIVQADHQMNQVDSTRVQSEKEAGVPTSNPASVPVVASGGEKVYNNEVIEWPRIYIALSRKEKEDDFFAMKGTKLPQRPKKRAKNIDRALQYCFPGMWLSDLTKSRYEVREKKCVKKQKRRGLKGMESMDSDSE
ncbi:unnamed protein product [Dovyalis caffra]|uniref:TAFII28-like protein domain-containing protein n=1 Tax=Dovyalis caffra TaxID=77055 RepID=A0AAV1RK67_9ROSI|nr:unnamed protein product [Dovyalis caffra]